MNELGEDNNRAMRHWTEGEVESDDDTSTYMAYINSVHQSVMAKMPQDIVSKTPVEAETICHVCYRPLPISLMNFHLIKQHDFLNNPANSNIFAKYCIDVMKHSFSANVFQILHCERNFKKRIARLLELDEQPELHILEVP